ncbi:MAG TPA: transcription termination/antitermination NusG family protein [Terriglobia bacterium]|nr:transcription termination/antitermination NusG family protein [Terriglobia bacterium]
MALSSTEPNWFALHVRTNTEHQVAAMLRSKGYEEFSPSTNSGKKRALFPGYVFCRIVPNTQGLIVTTPGVIRIVSFGGKAAPIDPEEIHSIQLVVNSGAPSHASTGLQGGDLVRIEEGPLRGAVGTLISAQKQQRFAVSVTMMMRTVIAEVNPEWLKSISPWRRPVSSSASHGAAL